MTPRSCMRRLFRMRRKPPEVAEVITSLRRIDTLLQEMILKYERELAETQTLLHDAIQQKQPRARLRQLLRRKKLLEKHADECQTRLSVSLHKQCALEQLELTRLQLAAVEQAGAVYYQFTRLHDLDRVEQLQSDMEHMQEDVMDVHTLLVSPTMDIDVTEELEELEQLVRAEPLPELPLPLPEPPQTEQEPEQNVELALAV